MFSPARLMIVSKPARLAGLNSSWLGCHSSSPAFGFERTMRVICAPIDFRAGIRAEPTNPLAPVIATFICQASSVVRVAKTLPRILTHRGPECTLIFDFFTKKLCRIRALSGEHDREANKTIHADARWGPCLVRGRVTPGPDPI